MRPVGIRESEASDLAPRRERRRRGRIWTFSRATVYGESGTTRSSAAELASSAADALEGDLAGLDAATAPARSRARWRGRRPGPRQPRVDVSPTLARGGAGAEIQAAPRRSYFELGGFMTAWRSSTTSPGFGGFRRPIDASQPVICCPSSRGSSTP